MFLELHEFTTGKPFLINTDNIVYTTEYQGHVVIETTVSISAYNAKSRVGITEDYDELYYLILGVRE